jgi:hypothetical protein
MTIQTKIDHIIDGSDKRKWSIVYRIRGKKLYEWLSKILPILLLFAIVVTTGLRGVDFGYHWDEDAAQLHPLRGSILSGTLLPNYYIYPSVNNWLNLLVLVPSAVKNLLTNSQTGLDIAHLIKVINSQTFLLRLRSLRIIISALSIVWVYITIFFWKKNWLQAILAASILGFSFEIAYHSRWVATDVIMMQFGALSLLGIVLAFHQPERRGWINLAAVAAGLACGTKYPGGIFLLPVAFMAYQIQGRETRKRRILSVVGVVAIFFITYLISTPGTVLQPARFWQDVTRAVNIYGEKGHFRYTVTPGFNHLMKIFTYLGLALLSKYVPIALYFSLFSLVGAYAIWKESKKLGFVLVLLPLLYILYFSFQRVMIVRNLLVLTPFIAILSMNGIAYIWKRLTNRYFQAGLIAITIAALVVNAAWLFYAAETIRYRGTDRYVHELVDFIEDHPDTTFLVSERVRIGIEATNGEQLNNITTEMKEEVDVIAFYAYEVHYTIWPGNVRDLTITTFGPQEVNFNYYPTWEGNDRIILMNTDRAREIGIRIGEE